MSDDREITEGYPANSNGRQFRDRDGNSVTLLQLIERDPGWARSRIIDLERQVESLKDEAFKRGAMLAPPCFCCGYSGPGYFQPKTHECAERHHCLYKPEEL